MEEGRFRLGLGAVEAVRSEIERRGRTVRGALLWDPVRIIRSDFHAYGHYLIVDPATTPEDAPE